MLPYGRTWNCRITRRRERRKRSAEVEGKRETGMERKAGEERWSGAKERVGTTRYVVCAWRGWRLPHEALRAELSYPHIRTYIAERERSGA